MATASENMPQGRQSLGWCGFIKSTLPEGLVAWPPWWWCLLCVRVVCCGLIWLSLSSLVVCKQVPKDNPKVGTLCPTHVCTISLCKLKIFLLTLVQNLSGQCFFTIRCTDEGRETQCRKGMSTNCHMVWDPSNDLWPMSTQRWITWTKLSSIQKHVDFALWQCLQSAQSQ